MHVKVTVTDESIAIPLFGLNAPVARGALMVTSRSGSATAQVAVLESVPTGTLNDDQSISNPVNVDEIALVATVLPAESGFIFDGVRLDQLDYIAVDVTGTCVIDVSFVENRLNVDIGRSGGVL